MGSLRFWVVSYLGAALLGLMLILAFPVHVKAQQVCVSPDIYMNLMQKLAVSQNIQARIYHDRYDGDEIDEVVYLQRPGIFVRAVHFFEGCYLRIVTLSNDDESTKKTLENARLVYSREKGDEV